MPTNRIEPAWLDPKAEGRLFRELRWTIGRAILRQAVGEARLRAAVIVVLSLAFWASMYALMHEGFQLLNAMISHPASRAQMVHAIYNVFFLTLLVMICVSSSIIVYSTLFRGKDLRLLLTVPVRPKRIAWHKVQETLLFSGWGFFLMGSPLLIAYGVTNSAPWYYYVMLPIFMATFVVIPVCAGTLLCLLIVRFLPLLRYHAVGLLLALLLLVMVLVGWNVVRASSREDLLTPQWFHDTLTRMEFAQQRFLPSWWLSTGLLEAAHCGTLSERQSWRESLGFLSLLCSTSLVIYGAVGWVGQRFFIPAYHGLGSLVPAQRGYRTNRMDRLIEKLLRRIFTRPMRLLLLKDIKVFRRDPLQWLQGAVFGGLLAIYFLQLRRLYFQDVLAHWILMVSYLNVAVIGLMLATFTTRFIFPLLSLEGRRIWILATLPVRRESVLWSKFLFGCALSLLPCCGLVLLSDMMLQIGKYSLWIVGVHLLTCIVLSVALCGIAVGLGARFPNLQENSPAKIASGFGGTLTLVVSSILILVSVITTAVPTYFWAQSISRNNEASTEVIVGLCFGTAAMVLIGLAMTIIPMRIGLRHFRAMEF